MNPAQREAIRAARDEEARRRVIGKARPAIRAAGGAHRWPLPPGVEGRAVFSADGEHRYVLRREWDHEGHICAFVGLNPSTAEANVDDPTVRKCWSWASEWGYGSMVMLNVFAYRATDPRELGDPSRDLFGDNDAYLTAIAAEVSLIVAAWGNSKWVKPEEDRVSALLLDGKAGAIHCLGTNKDGSPRHPLYLANKTTPQLWRKRSTE